MERLTENKIVIVKRKTRLEELIARFNTIEQAKFYIEHMGVDFSDYVYEDKQYQSSVFQAHMQLETLGRVQALDREYVPNFIFGEDDIVVVIGQDGLVANTLKYLSHQPVIGINPDPGRWDGVLLPFTVNDLSKIIPEVFKGSRNVKEVSMAKASLNDGQTLYAVNDLFIGQRTHTSSRYNIQFGNMSENQSSSGIIVSTGLGSTGWLKSILAGASGIVNNFYKTNKALQITGFDWNVDYLYFSVREPFPSKSSNAGIIFGKITPHEPLSIISQMPENGVIFSDGMENDYILFNSGTRATVTVAQKKGHLVV